MQIKDVHPVQTQILNETDSITNESSSHPSVRDERKVTRLGICETPNREENLERAVRLFEEIELLEAAIEVVSLLLYERTYVKQGKGDNIRRHSMNPSGNVSVELWVMSSEGKEIGEPARLHTDRS